MKLPVASDKWQVTRTSGRWPVTSSKFGAAGAVPIFKTRHSSLVTRHCRGFTLVELLTVIAIIAIIAAMLMPVAGYVVRKAKIQQAQAEEKEIETAIESYKADYGFYPPDNPVPGNGPLTNQLLYELIGTTTNSSASPMAFQTLDNAVTNTVAQLNTVFGPNIGGFMNCNKPGATEDARPATTYLRGLKAGQIATDPGGVEVLTTAAIGDSTYQPMSDWKTLAGQPADPWRYNSSSPTNTPGAYDLWLQISVGGKLNLICNWKNQPQIGSTLP